MKREELTQGTLELFLELARDAGNWSGTPLFGGNVGNTTADLGHLTDLKKRGLVTTFEDADEGRRDFSGRRIPPSVWVEFTETGVELARSHGIEVRS